METTDIDLPRQSFAEDYLVWITLRHFLSPPLLRELLEITVSKVSDGRLKLSDLFLETFTDGDAAFASWAIRARRVDDRMGQHLQQVLKAILWHGDAQYPIDDNWPDQDRAAVKALSEAVAISGLDLVNLSADFEVTGAVLPLQRLLVCLASARTSINVEASDDVLNAIRQNFSDAALRSVVFKHVGDLLVDAERWASARALYVASTIDAGTLAKEWSGLEATLAPATLQSLAAVDRALLGAAETSVTLGELNVSAEHMLNWVALSNVPVDLLDASFAAGRFDALHDCRVAVIAAPNLIHGQNLSHALETWLDGRYEDAYRWFWSVLRRQNALGTAAPARFTKGLFGRCLIEGANETFASARQITHLALGIRMLIECGSAANAGRTEWSQHVVDGAINDSMLRSAIDATCTAPGYQSQRTCVLLVLLAKWCQKITLDKAEIARCLIETASAYATDGETSNFTGHNVRVEAFKALSAIATARPEFRALAGQPVMAASREGILDGSPIVAREAIRVAYEFASALEPDELVPFTSALLDIIDGAAPHPTELITSTSALTFLQSIYGRLDAHTYRDLRARVADALLSLSSSGSSQAAFISLLQNLEPEDAQRLSDPKKLGEIIDALQARAAANNRSDASDAMSALLEAPDIVGRDGIASALEGFQKTLAGAIASRSPAAFTDAYRPLLSLVRHKTAIEAVLGDSEGSLETYYSSTFHQLLELWRKAERDPSMFMAFAIPPPEVPDRTIVHNWTFASMAFSRSLGREMEMQSALAEAARNDLLRAAVLVASAVESPADVIDFEPGKPFPEATADAFYASLGRNLAAVSSLPRHDKVAYVRVLLEQCYRLGPRGEDAAVLVMALDLDILGLRGPGARDYERRLQNDRSLRLTLGPLLVKVSSRTSLGDE